MNTIPTIEVPAIHPRKRARKGAAQAEILRLTQDCGRYINALERIRKLATISSIDEIEAWSALGGIRYVAETALRSES